MYFGSAITGAGVAALVDGVRDLLPAAPADPAAPVDGTVFKIERGPAGEKVAYVRLFAGTIRVRQRYNGEKITAISVFDHGSAVPAAALVAGRIGTVRGLNAVRVGDPLGGAGRDGRFFAPPSLASVVEPVRAADRVALHAALAELAEQDPLINVRQDERRREIAVSLYGEVQKEVIQATLLDDYGLEVAFRDTTTICVERPAGVGEAVELKDSAPFLATVGLRVEPARGVSFRLGVELGSMPLAFFKAVEETVHETLREGLCGWQVIDCAVTMIGHRRHPGGAVHALAERVPSLTRGEGSLESAFDRYDPVRGRPPVRPRTDHNPLDRKEYLLHVVRRV